MTTHRLFAGVALFVLTFWSGADHAFAQAGGRTQIFNSPGSRFGGGRSLYSQRPTLSPYLNLLRSNGGPVLNYYGLVRPEQNFRATTQDIQQQFDRVDQQLQTFEQREAASSLGITGHRTRFLSDRQGGPGSVTTTLTSRDARLQTLPPVPGSRIAPTGHAGYFNNPGTYYQFPNRQQ